MKKKHNKNYNNNQDVVYYQRKLYPLDKNIKGHLNALKRDSPIARIKTIVRNLDSHPYVKKFFYGTPFPQSIKELGNAFYTISCDVTKELEVLSLLFSKYLKEINEFVKLRQDFQKKFIVGKYDHASEVLNSIESKFGYSLWLMENRFLIAEYTGGIKANKGYLTFVNQSSNETFATTLAYYYSVKSETRVSALNYSNRLVSLTTDLKKHVKDYLEFKLRFLGSESQITELTDVISFESLFSVIDRYESFLKLVQLIVLNDIYDENSIGVKDILIYLNGRIDDILLKNLCLKYDIGVGIVFSEADIEIINIFELYTNDECVASLQQAIILLSKYPNEFSLYEIYVKSLLLLDAEFEYVGDDQESVQNFVLENLYHIYKKDKHTKASLLNLQKIVKQVDGLGFPAQIYSFVKRINEKESNQRIQLLDYLNSSIFNPIHYLAFMPNNTALSYLEKFKEFSQLNVIKFFISFNSIKNVDDIPLLDISGIAIFRLKMYKAEALMKLGIFDQAILLFNSVISESNIPTSIYEECIRGLFECYFRIEDFNTCIDIYVSNYLLNSNLIIRINYRDLHKKIESAKFKNIQASINLPLFYRITGRDNHLTNVTIRFFLKKYELLKPQDIITLLEIIDKQKIIFFLRSVCVPEIIKYFIFYNSTKEILSDRLEIYQVLLVIDEDHTDEYVDEIGKIAQELAISEGIKQVDESKIYVDEKSLVNSEFEEIKGNFIRFIEISNLVSDIPFVLIDLINNKQILVNIPLKEHESEEIRRSKIAEDLKLELFKEIFYEIRNAFLFNSKYGLDSYLSTRIRHGTLLGQIRSQFQDQNLITQKNKDTEAYYPNEYWAEKLDYLSDSQLASIQLYLADFSDRIDSLISKLKDELIQIRIENKHEKGLFNYIYFHEELLILFKIVYKNIDDYGEFIKGIFSDLWDRTNRNLSVIRNYISSTIKNEFDRYLDELTANLKALNISTIEFQELLSNIIHCKTNISYEMDKISDWFNIRDVAIKEFNIVKAIDTSLEITNKISQGKRIVPRCKIVESSTTIKGNFFIHFFDLFRIFLENIVKYSELSTEDLDVTVTAIEEPGLLKISLKNNLNEEVDKSQVDTLLKRRFDELNGNNWDMEKIKTETGTGFYKAKKILSSDLLDVRNFFKCFLNSDSEVEVNIEIHLSRIKYEETTTS
ncbi:hypothetical protein CLV51_1062 [Chitinophaga niastensis]|uniref:Uncharacterized protein n=1 Tax=Chitinophaga niastensis TaxID=536980 RepID=A0A2P8HD50_CHINA|nr:hypothetical protein [Chitinophaga niastensis]PSL44137.1 hypothetical protein CLV51_1062 [Chitinophaga niastensis]